MSPLLRGCNFEICWRNCSVLAIIIMNVLNNTLMGCSLLVGVILKFNFSFVFIWFCEEWPNTDWKGRRGKYCVKYRCWSHHLTLFQYLSEACKFCVYYEIHLAAISHDIFFCFSLNVAMATIFWQTCFSEKTVFQPVRLFEIVVMWSKIAQTTS